MDVNPTLKWAKWKICIFFGGTSYWWGGVGGVCEKLQANKQMPFHKIIFWEKSDFFWDTLLVEGGGLGGGGLKKNPDSENIAQI